MRGLFGHGVEIAGMRGAERDEFHATGFIVWERLRLSLSVPTET
jgi:hypothetical protein